jgi:hypothetical protein
LLFALGLPFHLAQALTARGDPMGQCLDPSIKLFDLLSLLVSLIGQRLDLSQELLPPRLEQALAFLGDSQLTPCLIDLFVEVSTLAVPITQAGPQLALTLTHPCQTLLEAGGLFTSDSELLLQVRGPLKGALQLRLPLPPAIAIPGPLQPLQVRGQATMLLHLVRIPLQSLEPGGDLGNDVVNAVQVPLRLV